MIHLFRYLFLNLLSILHQDDGLLDLTIEQRKELCLKVPCKVELFHSNICVGIEKYWPKQMYGQDDFRLLTPEQKQRINKNMERHGVKQYNENIDEKALAKRVADQRNITLAPYLELNYRKNLFQRIEACGKSPMVSDVNDNV